MSARIGVNVTVAVQSVIGTAKTISAITQANPGVVTLSTSPIGLVAGDVVVLTVTAGMVELDGQAVRVGTVSGSTVQLEGLDTTLYTAFTAGTLKKVTTFSTLSTSQTVSMPNPAANKIDLTTLIDNSKQYTYGLADAPDGTIEGLYDPSNAAVAIIKAASKAKTALAFRLSWSTGQKCIFNAYVSGGQGFDQAQNDVAKASIAFTPIKDVMDYAS